MKEIKVRLYLEENDSYVELWKVINPEKGAMQYYGRYTYQDQGTWYTVSDPLGYCELNSVVKKDIVFVLCDKEGNECCRYSNADKNPLMKRETVIKAEWDKIKDTIQHNAEDQQKDFFAESLCGETTMGINQWLLTFKDPDLYKNEIADMHGYDENWLYTRKEEIGYEPVPGSEFTYLGEKCQFTKIKYKHTVCGVEWIEYHCTDSSYEFGDYTHMYMGNWFDASNVGAMIDKRSAREFVLKGLKNIYPKTNIFQELLYVEKTGPYKILKVLSYEKAAEILLNNELHKEKVMKMVEDERVNPHFYLNTAENKAYIFETYPNIIECPFRSI